MSSDQIFRDYLTNFLNFHIQDFPDHDDSFFSAIAEHVFGDQQYFQHIRSEAREEVLRNPMAYAFYGQLQGMDDLVQSITGLVNGHPAMDFAIQATAIAFNCIIVLYEDGRQPEYFGGEGDEVRISRHEGNRYCLLTVPDEEDMEE